MNKRALYLLILFSPFLLMVTVNEYIRTTNNDVEIKIQGIKSINPANKNKDKCTWSCHNDTNYCKENHVKLAKPYFKFIDPIYFGIIHILKSTGNYGLANVVLLVILIPFLMYFFLVKSIGMQFKIREIRKLRK
jgi:hypothetical protein